MKFSKAMAVMFSVFLSPFALIGTATAQGLVELESLTLEAHVELPDGDVIFPTAEDIIISFELATFTADKFQAQWIIPADALALTNEIKNASENTDPAVNGVKYVILKNGYIDQVLDLVFVNVRTNFTYEKGPQLLVKLEALSPSGFQQLGASEREEVKIGQVTLVGFGTFAKERRRARKGRNPQTGEPIKIKAKNVVKFKAGKKLQEAI